MSTIRIKPAALTAALASIAALLGIGHVVVIAATFHLGAPYSALELIDLDREGNLPAFYSACALLLCSGSLACVARATRQRGGAFVLHWGLLALVFLFLALDEMLQLHERLSGPIRRRLAVPAQLYTAWIIPYGAGLLALAWLYARFLLALPRPTLAWFLAAGATFAAGSIGVESLSGVQFLADGKTYSETYYWIIMVEELLEMAGVIAFLHALLRYAETHLGGVTLSVGSS